MWYELGLGDILTPRELHSLAALGGGCDSGARGVTALRHQVRQLGPGTLAVHEAPVAVLVRNHQVSLDLGNQISAVALLPSGQAVQLFNYATNYRWDLYIILKHVRLITSLIYIQIKPVVSVWGQRKYGSNS